MRKLFFVLLSVLLIAFTGCQSGNTPDAAVSSSQPEGAESVSGASSTDTSRSAGESSKEPPVSSTGDDSTSPSSAATENLSSTGRPDTSGTVSQKPAASAEQKPTAAPEQTNPPESASGNTSSASASSSPPATPSSEEKPITSEPPVSQPPETTSQPDMEAEYARIIREAVAYAESYAAKGFTFVWDDSLEFSWESGAGWMGTPRVKYEGVDGTIEMLKYHIDKIVKTSTDSGNGVPAHSANYKVMQVTVDGDIAFVVLYG